MKEVNLCFLWACVSAAPLHMSTIYDFWEISRFEPECCSAGSLEDLANHTFDLATHPSWATNPVLVFVPHVLRCGSLYYRPSAEMGQKTFFKDANCKSANSYGKWENFRKFKLATWLSVYNYVKNKHVRAETVAYFARRLCLWNNSLQHYQPVWRAQLPSMQNRVQRF